MIRIEKAEEYFERACNSKGLTIKKRRETGVKGSDFDFDMKADNLDINVEVKQIFPSADEIASEEKVYQDGKDADALIDQLNAGTISKEQFEEIFPRYFQNVTCLSGEAMGARVRTHILTAAKQLPANGMNIVAIYDGTHRGWTKQSRVMNGLFGPLGYRFKVSNDPAIETNVHDGDWAYARRMTSFNPHNNRRIGALITLTPIYNDEVDYTKFHLEIYRNPWARNPIPDATLEKIGTISTKYTIT